MGSNPTPGATLSARPEATGTPIERDEELLRGLRKLERVTFTAGAAVLVFALALNYEGTASIWDAAILTPAVIILLLLSLFLHDSATSTPWEGHFRVEGELGRSILMVFGALLVTIGGDPARVTIDMGGGDDPDDGRALRGLAVQVVRVRPS